MQDPIVEAISRLNVSLSDTLAGESESLRILWLSAFCTANKDSLNFRPHNHTFFEVHFSTRGHIVYRFDDAKVSVAEGSYLLIPPHSIHSIDDHSDDFRKVTISFEASEDSDVFSSLSDISKRSMETGADIAAALEFIVTRAGARSPYEEAIIKNRLVEIVYLMAASSDYRPPSTHAFYDSRLLKAKKFIEDNPQIFLSCEEVAQFCHLSSKQLGRLFQQYESCSLLDFIHGQKVEAAKRLIRETDEIFESISEQLGFSSVNYFGKFFYRCTGMTPGEYRKSYGA
jgi:AraC-like DNA-binding protein